MARSRTLDEFTKPTATVIGKGFTIQAARLTCEDSESMRIEGTVIGDIEIDGVLIISSSGYVDGSISAGSVRIAGRVTGNVQCYHALHLTSTADVLGDVNTSSLIIDDGAILLGRCKTNMAMDIDQAKLTCS